MYGRRRGGGDIDSVSGANSAIRGFGWMLEDVEVVVIWNCITTTVVVV